MNPRKDIFLLLGSALFLVLGVAVSLGVIPGLTPPTVPQDDQRALHIPELLAPPRGIGYPSTPKALAKAEKRLAALRAKVKP